MGKVGNFGTEIVFMVSDQSVLTFNNMTIEKSARWEETPVIGDKPKPQFLGPENMEISMDVVLDATLGAKPWQTRDKLQKALDEGKVDYLVIGKRKIGKFALTSMSEAWQVIMNGGELMRMTVSLTFREYH